MKNVIHRSDVTIFSARLTGLQVMDGVQLVEQGARADQGGLAAGAGAAADDGHAHVRPQKARPPLPALLGHQPLPLPLQPLLLPHKISVAAVEN